MGAALAAPRRALRAADTSGADGKASGDVAVLLAMAFVAVYARELTAAAWIGSLEGVQVGVSLLLTTMSQALAMKLVVLFVAAIGLTVMVGRHRSFGRDFDLACVAFIPLITVELAASLVLAGSNLLSVGLGELFHTATAVAGYGWAGAVLLLSWEQARQRDGLGKAEAVEQPRVLVRRVRLAGIAVAALAASVLVLNGAWIASNTERLRPVSLGDMAPSYTLPAVDAEGRVGAQHVDSTALRGKVVLLDFWATWCRPCRQSMPLIDRVYERYRGRGLEVLSINTDDPVAGREMLRSMGLSLPLYFDSGVVSHHFQVSSIPHLVLIDERGLVRHVHRGFQGEEILDRQVRELLEGH